MTSIVFVCDLSSIHYLIVKYAHADCHNSTNNVSVSAELSAIYNDMKYA